MKVMVIGGTLPEFSLGQRIVAVSYRTEQLVAPLLRDGHEVLLVGHNPWFPTEEVIRNEKGNLRHYQITFCRYRERFMPLIQKLHDEFSPECLVSTQLEPGILLCGLRTEAPRWCDLFGSPMGEGQAKAHLEGDDSWINRYWRMNEAILSRADAFSTCSAAQEHLVTGELASLGRLNRRTFGYRFAHAVPPGISGEEKAAANGEPILRGKRVGEGDPVILWSGGYNTWTDVRTLFRGLEEAFRQIPRLKFVSAGGEIANLNEQTYPRFVAMAKGSRFSNNYVFLGWRPYGDVLRLYAESDIGINIDSFHYELVYGTRTRIVEMIQNRLPVVTSLGCELSHVLRESGVGLTFPIGDWKELANRNTEFFSRTVEERRECAERAFRFFKERYSYETTTEPLRKWVKNPSSAPDRDERKRPIVVHKSNIDHYRELFESHPDGNISLKRLLKSKLGALGNRFRRKRVL